MSLLRRVRTVHAIAVVRAGHDVGDVAVQGFVRVLGKLDPLELLFARVVEETDLDLRGVVGEEREVDTLPVPRRAARVGGPSRTARLPASLMRTILHLGVGWRTNAAA